MRSPFFANRSNSDTQPAQKSHIRFTDHGSHTTAGVRWRMRAVAVLFAGFGTVMLGSGVFAAWTPTSATTSGAFAAADLAVQMVDTNGTTFTTGVSNLLPGDYLNRYMDLTNSGSVAQTFTGTITGSGTLANALTAQVDLCSVSWASNGTCSGTTTVIQAAASTASPVALTFPSQAASAVAHARLRFTLIPGAVQATYQGTTGSEAVNIAGSSTVAGGADRTAG